jgi:hypothetical protein
MAITPDEIRTRVGSFWLNSLEAELLGCIALELADICDCLWDMRNSATRSNSGTYPCCNGSDHVSISSIDALRQHLCEVRESYGTRS